MPRLKVGLVDGVTQICQRRNGCGGPGLPLGIGSNSGMISQVLLDHKPEGRGERKRLRAAERARLKPLRRLSSIGELGSGNMWHRHLMLLKGRGERSCG